MIRTLIKKLTGEKLDWLYQIDSYVGCTYRAHLRGVNIDVCKHSFPYVTPELNSEPTYTIYVNEILLEEDSIEDKMAVEQLFCDAELNSIDTANREANKQKRKDKLRARELIDSL